MPLPDILMYISPTLMVPLASVQHVETHDKHGLIVVTEHTRWDKENDTWANNIWVNGDEAEAFKKAWLAYLEHKELNTNK